MYLILETTSDLNVKLAILYVKIPDTQQQTCLENDGKWLEDRKVCKFNWN